MSPFFSIIIPTYNREEYIQDTILSVLSQNFKDFELIIVDNKSTDSTWELVRSFSDERMHCYQNEKNFERCYSRNRGMSLAKGSYILLLDSDDLYEQNHLMNWYEFIKVQNEKDCFFVSNKKVLENGKVTLVENSIISEHPVSYFFLNSILPGQVCFSSVIASCNKFRDDMLIFEDAALWMDISLQYPVYFNQIESFIYRVHDDNSVNELKYNAYSKRLVAIKKLLSEKKYSLLIPKNTIRIALSATYMGIFRYHKINSSYFIYMKWILLAILFFPTIQIKNKMLILLQLLPVFRSIPYFKNSSFY